MSLLMYVWLHKLHQKCGFVAILYLFLNNGCYIALFALDFGYYALLRLVILIRKVTLFKINRNMSAKKIIVTGFGPFGVHEVNASWECVKLLPSEIDGFEIIKEQVPVSYDTVDEKIQALWEQHQPEFVIHVGVSSFTDKITLETCAHKKGYTRQDIHGKLPKKGDECSVECSEVRIPVGVDVKTICDRLNSSKADIARLSDTAGRYLCEYTLFTSLSIGQDKAMFIHVPPLGQPFSEEELADAIVQIIKCILEQKNSCK